MQEYGDKSVTQFVKDHNIGGAMIWAANPSPKTNPRGAELCPQVGVAVVVVRSGSGGGSSSGGGGSGNCCSSN